MNWSGDPVQIQDIGLVIQRILNYAVQAAGIAVLVMIIVGGFIYLTSGGNPKKTEQGRNYITYAIFGLVLIIGAWFVLNVIAEFTGVREILNFEIVTP